MQSPGLHASSQEHSHAFTPIMGDCSMSRLTEFTELLAKNDDPVAKPITAFLRKHADDGVFQRQARVLVYTELLHKHKNPNSKPLREFLANYADDNVLQDRAQVLNKVYALSKIAT